MAKDYTLLAKTIVENVGGDENFFSSLCNEIKI